MKAAAVFAAGKPQVTDNVSSVEVLNIAEAWERWVLGTDDQETPRRGYRPVPRWRTRCRSRGQVASEQRDLGA